MYDKRLILCLNKVDKKSHGLETLLRSKALNNKKNELKYNYRCLMLKTNFFFFFVPKSIQIINILITLGIRFPKTKDF